MHGFCQSELPYSDPTKRTKWMFLWVYVCVMWAYGTSPRLCQKWTCIRCECSPQKCAGETEEVHDISWSCFSVLASHFEASAHSFSVKMSQRASCPELGNQIQSAAVLKRLRGALSFFSIRIHSTSLRLLYLSQIRWISSCKTTTGAPPSVIMLLNPSISPDVSQQSDSPCIQTQSYAHSPPPHSLIVRYCVTHVKKKITTHKWWDVLVFRSLFP